MEFYNNISWILSKEKSQVSGEGDELLLYEQRDY